MFSLQLTRRGYLQHKPLLPHVSDSDARHIIMSPALVGIDVISGRLVISLQDSWSGNMQTYEIRVGDGGAQVQSP
jgi:hypothetical protein